jgi:m7GpppX diphosphatase
VYRSLYYFPDHFHVHIVHTGHLGLSGMAVGQAHLLDDIISLVRRVHLLHVLHARCSLPSQLELDPDDGPSILERMTFTYGLGTEHGLYKSMAAALAELRDDVE